MVEKQKTSFLFGRNWKDYLRTVSLENINAAKHDIVLWLGDVSGKTVVDIGSGSGINSLAFYLLGAKSVHSFDVDGDSVTATKILWERYGKPQNWTVSYGSVLDKDFLRSIGRGFDIVYSWGVLHHTGALWDALGNAISMIGSAGKLFISVYTAGPGYAKDLALKKRYKSASDPRKKLIVFYMITKLILNRIRLLRNPFIWNRVNTRGMNAYHDMIDWLVGLPYETASPAEVVKFCSNKGLILERIQVKGYSWCSVYVFGVPTNTEKGEKT